MITAIGLTLFILVVIMIVASNNKPPTRPVG